MTCDDPVAALRAQQTAFQQAIVLQRDDLAPPWRTVKHRPSLLRVYQFAYTARLAAALRDNHALLPRVMGDDAFDALAMAYIQAEPSRHPSIRWYGHRLADFMAERGDLVPHPALTDLARMEWALRTAFDARDANPLTPAALSEVPPEAWPRLVFELHPGVQLVSLAWAVEPVWQALKDLGDEGDGAEDPELPEPQAHAHVLAAWRVGLDTRWRSVDPADAPLLAALQAGEPFAALCAQAAQTAGEAEAAACVVAALQAWLADGWLSGWRLAEAPA